MCPDGDSLALAVNQPVEGLDTGSEHQEAEEGMALCLSGGGYRAMVFHLGVLWRLYELGLLNQLDRISSVSGGSITSAVLGLKWSRLSFSPDTVLSEFVPEVVDPIRALAGRTLDASSIIEGLLLPGTVSEKVAQAYAEYLFGDATLQSLPDQPRFVFNATNVQSGALWRFMKPYMRDYRVGEVKNPTLKLALAVAASSAFPPVLSPLTLKLDTTLYTPDSGKDLQREPFTTRVVLTDGGVYDNLGLETAWKRYKTILVSDAGAGFQAEEEPKHDWGRHAYRVLGLIDNQVRSLRKRQVIDSFASGVRQGAYWGIRTHIDDYGLGNTLPCPANRTDLLATVPTRLKRLDDETQKRLINWGYAVCDAAIRKHVMPALPTPSGFPFPASAV